jgi:hypothetical protein
MVTRSPLWSVIGITVGLDEVMDTVTGAASAAVAAKRFTHRRKIAQ